MKEQELKKIEETKTDSSTTEKVSPETMPDGETPQKKEDPKATTSSEGAGEVIKPFNSQKNNP